MPQLISSNTFKMTFPSRKMALERLYIRPAQSRDLPTITKLEKSIEGSHAAPKGVLQERLRSFGETFLVATKDDRVIGYAEACRWKLENFGTFDEIKDFASRSDRDGRNLYVAFLAVDPKLRQRGIGSKLIEILIETAKRRRLAKVQLVSKPELISFYKNLGFSKVKDLPSFLPYSAGVLMERRIENNK
jgi:ribosomal protein S18 acetylase RimI-like enzyme